MGWDDVLIAVTALQRKVEVDLRELGPPQDRGEAWEKWLHQVLPSADLCVERAPLPGDYVAIAYLDTLVDKRRLAEDVFAILVGAGDREDPRGMVAGALWSSDPQAVLRHLGDGCVALLMAGREKVALIPVAQLEGRSVSASSTEPVLIGPKEAFTESLTTAVNLVRQRLRDPRLRFISFRAGRLSQVPGAFLYVEGICPDATVYRIERLLPRLQTVDYVRNTSDVRDILFPEKSSAFPTDKRTERPEMAAMALSQGRLVILLHGSPFALIFPTTLNELTHGLETMVGSGLLVPTFIRWMRYIGLLGSLLAPGFYAAFMSVSPQVLLPDLLVNVAATRQGVPYPVLYETLIMILILDVVTEAALLAPAPLGQTLTIVGTLVIGQAAVQAKLASNFMIIILAITSIGVLLSADIPLAYAVRLAKYPLTALGGVFGITGLSVGLILLSVRLASLRSLDVPYLAPLGPTRLYDLLHYAFFPLPKGRLKKPPQTWRPETTRGQHAG
ncbi:MAG: spore germination protein [Bacillota bacterium]|nr:spore germination protein [Bacillota bacterium]